MDSQNQQIPQQPPTLETQSKTIKNVILIVIILSILLILVIVTGSYFFIKYKMQLQKPAIPPKTTVKIEIPTPTPFVFRNYTAPKVEKKAEYSIVMIGDSMTNALGPHGGTFNTFINDLYKPDHIGILIDNYGLGSTSILTISDAMTTKTTYWDSTFEPLLSRQFDLILIESFGYNPLSQFTLAEGLKKQTQILDETIKTLIFAHPQAVIVFVATIAPNKETYAAKELPNLTTAERIQEAEERISYIKNHIDFAKSHTIPLVDIYDKSLTASGDGDITLINPNDNIHPSFKGVDFIGHELANFIYNNQLLPR